MCLNHFYLCEVMSETPKLTQNFDFSFLKIGTLKYFNYKKIKVPENTTGLQCKFKHKVNTLKLSF